MVINFCGEKWQGGAPESVANDGLAGWWRHFPYPIIFICPSWGKPSSDGALSPSPPDIISIHRGKQGKTADIRQGKALLPRPPSRAFGVGVMAVGMSLHSQRKDRQAETGPPIWGAQNCQRTQGKRCDEGMGVKFRPKPYGRRTGRSAEECRQG
ncbi:hypothetical protein D3C84_721950 [compost metagenome]